MALKLGPRVNFHHTYHHDITTLSLFRRLNLLDIDSYYHKLGSAFSAGRLPTGDVG